MCRSTSIFWIAFWLFMAGAAHAADRMAIEQRVADAVAVFEARGVGELCAAASDPTGPLQADDAYVFVFLRDGRLICHPRPDLNEMRAGQMTHVPRLLGNTEAQPSGAWTHYPWPHPDTLKLGTKSTYCRISRRLIICAGSFLDAGLS